MIVFVLKIQLWLLRFLYIFFLPLIQLRLSWNIMNIAKKGLNIFLEIWLWSFHKLTDEL